MKIMQLKKEDILLQNNKEWAKQIKQSDPDFFKKLSLQQTPECLWIGCSDSRVPSTQIVDVLPGEIFVHRNIANLVIHTDMNCLSVIQYAINVLKVKHIIVCGHYNCGGIRAAMETRDDGPIDNWLQPIRDTYQKYKDSIDSIESEEDRLNKLTEFNIIEQVANISKINYLKKAWEQGEEVTIHGWIYSIQDGIIKSLNIDIASEEDLSKLQSIQ